jgi:hypothetical protein
MIERVREKKASFSKKKYHHRFIINKKTAVMTVREGQRKAELSVIIRRRIRHDNDIVMVVFLD